MTCTARVALQCITVYVVLRIYKLALVYYAFSTVCTMLNIIILLYLISKRVNPIGRNCDRVT